MVLLSSFIPGFKYDKVMKTDRLDRSVIEFVLKNCFATILKCYVLFAEKDVPSKYQDASQKGLMYQY
jgi:hypothetical protein